MFRTENNNISGTFAFHNSEIEITDETGQNLGKKIDRNFWRLNLCIVPAIQWSDAQVGKYLTNPISGIDRFPTLDEAKNKCLLTDGCVGVTMIPGTPSTYEIRSGPDLMTSGVGANSWTYSVQDPQITMKKGGKYSIKMDLKDDLTENCQARIKKLKFWNSIQSLKCRDSIKGWNLWMQNQWKFWRSWYSYWFSDFNRCRDTSTKANISRKQDFWTRLHCIHDKQRKTKWVLIFASSFVFWSIFWSIIKWIFQKISIFTKKLRPEISKGLLGSEKNEPIIKI